MTDTHQHATEHVPAPLAPEANGPGAGAGTDVGVGTVTGTSAGILAPPACCLRCGYDDVPPDAVACPRCRSYCWDVSPRPYSILSPTEAQNPGPRCGPTRDRMHVRIAGQRRWIETPERLSLRELNELDQLTTRQAHRRAAQAEYWQALGWEESFPDTRILATVRLVKQRQTEFLREERRLRQARWRAEDAEDASAMLQAAQPTRPVLPALSPQPASSAPPAPHAPSALPAPGPQSAPSAPPPVTSMSAPATVTRPTTSAHWPLPPPPRLADRPVDRFNDSRLAPALPPPPRMPEPARMPEQPERMATRATAPVPVPHAHAPAPEMGAAMPLPAPDVAWEAERHEEIERQKGRSNDGI